MSDSPSHDAGSRAGPQPPPLLRQLEWLLKESADAANPTAKEIRSLLDDVKTVAVVGLSRDPLKAARRVPSYLAAKGYHVIPVNPNAASILGQPARDTLDEVTDEVDLVLLFRPSDEAGDFVETAAARDERPAIWLQEGIMAPEAAAAARDAGLTVVQDLCIFKAHRSLPRNQPRRPATLPDLAARE